ncbi:hypothetical protein ACTUQ0_14725, partial [Listeria monocytogenes]|uniref:hypothetical protein n=1 Tax=Listeria monocytogenes TaxID=1639 RepID=UPI003FA47EC4
CAPRRPRNMPAVDAAAAVRMTTELCAVLRRRGLPIAPPEVLDAVRALSIVGFEERNGTREVLDATLVKRAADRALFRRAFDEFFDGKGRRPR